jgi:hypothetical protein
MVGLGVRRDISSSTSEFVASICRVKFGMESVVPVRLSWSSLAFRSSR